MHFLIGDLQGCDDAFDRLLAHLGFSASRHTLTLLGDLVNRGPGSRRVIERVMGMDGAAQALLGNHDLHLLAVAAGARTARRGDTIDDILDSSRRGAMLAWLRARPLAVQTNGWLCVHAGVSPSWSAPRTLELAGEVQAALRGRDGDAFLHAMYGHEPVRWDDALQGHDRLRHIVNVLTRIRFCKDDGTLEFDAKEGADRAPAGYLPWFDVPSRVTADERIAFGHWSTLGLLQRPTLLGLDTGCVWGGKLTAACVDRAHVEITQVDCPACRKPGVGG